MSGKLIKNLQISQPRGAPFDFKTLRNLGISSALAHKYVKSGWLQRLGRGVFMFAGDELKRNPTLKFLESRIPDLHVASKTALAWHGYRQNVANQETIILWGETGTSLPKWFVSQFPSRHSTSRLFNDDLPSDFGLATLPESPNGPQISTPERALLEMLSEVGVKQEIDEARAIMESVRQLRSRELTSLLTSCRMIKAIRLCVNWSAELSLPWASIAREAVHEQSSSTRWVRKLKDGSNLTLKP